MEKRMGAEFIAQIMKEEGVKQYFGVHGGHLWALLVGVARAGGIKMYHMRHEQSGVYAADGWARTTGKPGVCFGTAGPGLGNMVPGLIHAYLARSPVIAIAGQHSTSEDTWGPFQEAYADSTCSRFTKWTKRIVDFSTISYFVQKAFRDATSYPPGPVVLEIPVDILSASGMAYVDSAASTGGAVPIGGAENYQRGYLPKGRCAPPSAPAGDPAMVEKAVRMLLEAKKPIAIGGDGIFWSKASDELKEFVELLNIPILGRRMGRGAVPETHPLAFSSGYKRPLFRQADVVVLFGLLMNMLENFGMEPTYPTKNVRYIRVSEDLQELSTRVPTDISIFGSPKLVLKQMIDCAKDLMKEAPERNEWLGIVGKAKEAAVNETKESVDKVRNNVPIHPDFLAAEIVDFLDKDATIILDSFSMSGFATDKLQASFAGQILDAATWGGVGHGVGMGMGAQLARPGKQVVDLLGDGGLGVTGWDIETTARYNLPVCYLLFNNSGWESTTCQKLAIPMVKDSWGMQRDIRYDKIFAEMNCHTEFVTKPDQIRPALYRAFNSGRTSLINVIPDDTIIPPQMVGRIAYYQKFFGKE